MDNRRTTTEKYRTEVIIFGTGIAGLFTALRLAEQGRAVLVVERCAALSSGATRRSGDLLHTGGFHSAVIDDEDRALVTAANCRAGAAEIMRFSPEAVLASACPVFLLIADVTSAGRAVRRWAEAGIPFSEVSSDAALRQIGLAGFAPIPGTSYFRTGDLPLDWTAVCQKIYDILARAGIRFLFGATILERRRDRYILDRSGETLEISFAAAVHATGYGMKETAAAHSEHFREEVRIELWKSHSLVSPPLNRSGFLYIDPGLPSFMPSAQHTIINVSQFDTLVERADLEVMPDQVAVLGESLARVGFDAGRLRKGGAFDRACLKPNLLSAASRTRTVGAEAIRVSEQDIIALPGKATEAPVLASKVLALLREGTPSFASRSARPGPLTGSPAAGDEIYFTGVWRAASVKVVVDPVVFSLQDVISSHYEDSWNDEKSRSPGAYNGKLARFINVSCGPNNCELLVGTTDFGSYVASRASGFSELFPGVGRANPLGTTTVLVTDDNFAIVTRRSLDAAQNPGGLYFVGGYANPPDDTEWNLFSEALREVEEETGVRAAETDGGTLIGLSLDREHHHAEAFFLLRTSISSAAVIERMRAAKDGHEHSVCSAVPFKQLLKSRIASNWEPSTWSFRTALSWVKLTCNEGPWR